MKVLCSHLDVDIEKQGQISGDRCDESAQENAPVLVNDGNVMKGTVWTGDLNHRLQKGPVQEVLSSQEGQTAKTTAPAENLAKCYGKTTKTKGGAAPVYKGSADLITTTNAAGR